MVDMVEVFFDVFFKNLFGSDWMRKNDVVLFDGIMCIVMFVEFVGMVVVSGFCYWVKCY